MKMLLLVLCCFSATAFAQSLELARDGKALADIAVGGSGAGRAAGQAAADLASYLKRITGADFAVIKEAQVKEPPRALIVVGAGKLAAAAGIDPASLPPEGFLLRAAPGRLYIVGADRGSLDGGTWYGVADLLERDLGVRWLWPGELGTVVPRKTSLSLGRIDRTGAPALHLRHIRDGIANLNPQKLGRGMTELEMDTARHAAMRQASDEWTSHLRLGGNFRANYGHGFTTWWEKHHDSHPEYFAMMPDGSRTWPWSNYDRVKICVSNQAVARQWMENAREFFRRSPEFLSFSASPNDNVFQGNCVCPECEKWDDPNGEKYTMNWRAGGKDVAREHVSLTDRYVRFYNRVAEMLAQEFPDKLVGGYAYGSWKNPPLRERNLRPNVLVGYVGFNDLYVAGASRRKDLEQWDEWATLARNLFYRPNLLHTGHGLPLVFIHKLAADIQHRAERNMMGCDFDSLVHHWSTQGINYYVLAKLLWNPRLDVDALLDDYCRTGFGAAAGEVRKYYLAVEKATDELAAGLHGGERRSDAFLRAAPDVYSPAVLGQWRALLAAAARQVPADSVYARRIAWLQLGLDYASLQSKTLALTRSPELSKEQREQVGRLAAERDAWYRAHLYDWSVFPPLLKWQEPAAQFGRAR